MLRGLCWSLRFKLSPNKSITCHALHACVTAVSRITCLRYSGVTHCMPTLQRCHALLAYVTEVSRLTCLLYSGVTHCMPTLQRCRGSMFHARQYSACIHVTCLRYYSSFIHVACLYVTASSYLYIPRTLLQSLCSCNEEDRVKSMTCACCDWCGGDALHTVISGWPVKVTDYRNHQLLKKGGSNRKYSTIQLTHCLYCYVTCVFYDVERMCISMQTHTYTPTLRKQCSSFCVCLCIRKIQY